MSTDDSNDHGRSGTDPGAPADAGSARRGDSGRETQPADEESIEHSARTAERLDRQRRSFDDAAGINPDRSQGSGADPGPGEED